MPDYLTVQPTIPVDSEDTPSAEDIWRPSSILWPQWDGPMVNRSSFQTAVRTSLSDAEQRRSAYERPSMAVSYQTASRGIQRTAELMNWKMRHGQAGSYIPLWSDTVTVPAERNDTMSLRFENSTRRLFVGQQILVWLPEDLDTWTITTMVGVNRVPTSDDKDNDESVSLFASLPVDLRGRVRVTPLFEGLLNLQGAMSVQTDHDLDAPIEAIEKVGDSAMPWFIKSGDIAQLEDPDYTINRPFTVQLGYPVWDVRPAFNLGVRLSVERTGSFATAGIDRFPIVYGQRARVGLDFACRFFNRTDAWRAVQLFHYAAGRAHPFWVPSPLAEIQLLRYQGNEVVVKAVGAEVDWAWRPYVSFLSRSTGAYEIYRVDAVTRSNGEDFLTLADLLSSGLLPAMAVSDVRTMSCARLCRFRSDEITEAWVTPELVDIGFQVIEVLEEKTLAIRGPGGYSGDDLYDPVDHIVPLHPVEDVWDPMECTSIL